MFQSVVEIKDINRTPEGTIALKGPSHKMHVVSSTEVPRGRWPNAPVVVQHAVGISIGMQFVKKIIVLSISVIQPLLLIAFPHLLKRLCD